MILNDDQRARLALVAEAWLGDQARPALVRYRYTPLQVLALQRLQSVGQLGRNAVTFAVVYLGPLHPLHQHVTRAATHGRYGCDTSQQAWLLAFLAQH